MLAAWPALRRLPTQHTIAAALRSNRRRFAPQPPPLCACNRVQGGPRGRGGLRRTRGAPTRGRSQRAQRGRLHRRHAGGQPPQPRAAAAAPDAAVAQAASGWLIVTAAGRSCRRPHSCSTRLFVRSLAFFPSSSPTWLAHLPARRCCAICTASHPVDLSCHRSRSALPSPPRFYFPSFYFPQIRSHPSQDCPDPFCTLAQASYCFLLPPHSHWSAVRLPTANSLPTVWIGLVEPSAVNQHTTGAPFPEQAGGSAGRLQPWSLRHLYRVVARVL